MKQEDIKYVYEIESSLDLDEVIDSLREELNLEKGILMHFSLSKDDLIKEELPIAELKTKVLKLNVNKEHSSLIFQDVEINVDDGRIEIVSKINLELKNIDIDKIVEK